MNSLAQRSCLSLVVSSLGLAGCTNKGSSSSPGPASAAGQGTASGACLGIVDGQATSAFPSTYIIVLLDPTSGQVQEQCTGVFVSDNTMLTAAHCIPSAGAQYLVALSNQELVVQGQATLNAGVHALQAFVDPSLQASQGTYAPAANQPFSVDIAVVVFPNNTASSFASVATASSTPGTPVTVVGYGSDDIYSESANGTITKKTGVNQIAQPNTAFPYQGLYQTFAWGHPGESAAHGQDTSSDAPGDSGGPLFLGGTTTVLGTVKYGYGTQEVPNIQSMIGTDAVDFFVDVTNATATALFTTATAGGARITQASAIVATGAAAVSSASSSAASPTSPASLASGSTASSTCQH